ncbi:MAG: hypothetical protein ABIS38_01735 [Sphingomicrobium sp.]
MIHLEEPPPGRPVKRQLNMTMIAVIGGLVLLVLMFAYFAGNRDPNQDKLSDSQLNGGSATAAVTGEKNCASKATYDLIKRELFRRAAQRRGSDAAAYDKLSAYAVARMENPVMESEDAAARAVECSGTLALDLPPGVVIDGGRRTLMSQIDYGVRPAADGSGNAVVVRNADALIAPLATIARASQATPRPAPVPPATDSLGQPVTNGPPPAPPPVVAPPPPAPAPQASANPSFNCRNARTRGEIAVCAAPGLANLDRQMAGQFNRAIGEADGNQRFQLLRTRAEFLQYRDSCRSDSCIADAYNGRIREIADIMAGRWRQR